jgi:hypothetical protein
MSEGVRSVEGIGPGTGRRGTRAPGRGPHPLRAAFAALGWRPTNSVARWIDTLDRETKVEQAITQIPVRWSESLRSPGRALRAHTPPPWDLLRLLPPYAVHDYDPTDPDAR